MIVIYKKEFFLIFSIFIIGMSALCGCISSKGPFFDMSRLENCHPLMPVAIIGSGPAGLTASIYGARGGFRTYVFEGNKPGGLLTETTEVENWPGEAVILGPELMQRMHAQAERLGVVFVADSVEAIDLSTWPYKLQLDSGDSVYALSIIMATGSTPRKLGIRGEEEYWGYGVTTCAVCDAPFRKGQKVIVIGGGDSAIEEAIQLAPHAQEVTIMVRKDHMRAAQRMQDRLSGYPNITIKYNVDVLEVLGEQKKGPLGLIKHVVGVRVYDNKHNVEYDMPDINGVFLAIGHTPNSQLVEGSIQCDRAGYIKTEDHSQKTSQEGVFVAGDVADHVYRQAITSAGSGCMAALDAANFLGNIGFNEQIAENIMPFLYHPDGMGESSVYHIYSLQELEQILAHSDGLVVIDFYGQACPSCLQMLPIYEQVAHEFKDRITFIKVDIDEAEDVVHHFNVVKVPCIVLMKDGKPLNHIYKTMRRKELVDLLHASDRL